VAFLGDGFLERGLFWRRFGSDIFGLTIQLYKPIQSDPKRCQKKNAIRKVAHDYTDQREWLVLEIPGKEHG
jgi:hypothetical protein